MPRAFSDSGQYQPDGSSDNPSPPTQQNAPPDKVAPGPFNSPNVVPPDDKAEANAPALKMDSAAEKKLPASESEGETINPPKMI
jgi:hypothetical protein